MPNYALHRARRHTYNIHEYMLMSYLVGWFWKMGCVAYNCRAMCTAKCWGRLASTRFQRDMDGTIRAYFLSGIILCVVAYCL